jgi:hypothetical protein
MPRSFVGADPLDYHVTAATGTAGRATASRRSDADPPAWRLDPDGWVTDLDDGDIESLVKATTALPLTV